MSPKWKTGYWINKEAPAYYWYMTENAVRQDNLSMLEHEDLAINFNWQSINLNQSVEYGSFGPANKEVAAVSGQEEYNIKMGDKVGVLSEDGSKIHLWVDNQRVTTREWISDEQLKAMVELLDHIDLPRLNS